MNELHQFFEDQYQALNEKVDDIAERIRALGGPAIGTLADFVQRTRLKEHPGHYPEAQAMLVDLLADHELLIRQLRRDFETCADEYHVWAPMISYWTCWNGTKRWRGCFGAASRAKLSNQTAQRLGRPIMAC